MTRQISLLSAFLLTVGAFAMGTYAAQPAALENRTDLTGPVLAQESPSIVYESADILHYEDGSPYIHDILTNHTDQRIIETEYCMFAYNEKGLPLKLHWNFLDSSAESSYENLVRAKTDILPGQTEDYQGGWSLYLPETENDEAAQAAYALCCLKQVVFEDNTVWNNPDYENWFETYAGKETDINELQNYYPFQFFPDL